MHNNLVVLGDFYPYWKNILPLNDLKHFQFLILFQRPEKEDLCQSLITGTI